MSNGDGDADERNDDDNDGYAEQVAEEARALEVANLADKISDLESKLEKSEAERSSAVTRYAIVNDEVNGLLNEIATVKKYARPIVKFAFGRYNKWRHTDHGKPGLLEAYEFFRTYIKDPVE